MCCRSRSPGLGLPASSPPSPVRFGCFARAATLGRAVHRLQNMASVSRHDAFLANPASFIDHTLLKPQATTADVQALCAEARAYGFATVCVNSRHIATCAKELQGAATIPIAVVGFPLGACATEAKVFETLLSIKLGAKEVDMVIDVGSLLAGDSAAVQSDIEAVVRAAAPVPVKVIIETCLLPTPSAKEEVCRLSKAAGAAFVKTSTGFSTGGATAEDIKLMRRTVGEEVGVKASGGIRTWADARRMVEAGASRIGASASVAMIDEFQKLKANGAL